MRKRLRWQTILPGAIAALIAGCGNAQVPPHSPPIPEYGKFPLVFYGITLPEDGFVPDLRHTVNEALGREPGEQCTPIHYYPYGNSEVDETYDPQGFLLTMHEYMVEDGEQVSSVQQSWIYRYDEQSRPVAISYRMWSGPDALTEEMVEDEEEKDTILITYDPAGHVTRLREKGTESTAVYNELGQLVRFTLVDKAGKAGDEGFEYNPDGRIRKRTRTGRHPFTETFGYDHTSTGSGEEERVTVVKEQDGVRKELTYRSVRDTGGHIIELQSRFNHQKISWSRGRIDSVANLFESSLQKRLLEVFTYDKAGNILMRTGYSLKPGPAGQRDRLVYRKTYDLAKKLLVLDNPAGWFPGPAMQRSSIVCF